MAVLSSKQRNKLPDSAFAGPDRSYPVHDKVSAATNVAGVVTDLNALITKLKAAGIMA